MLAAILLLAALAADPQSSPTFIQTYEVRVSNIDVVVTSANGVAAHGLRKDDFQVYEDGVRQPITNFAEYTRSAGTATATAAPAEAEPASPPARFVFLVDELSLHPVTRGKLLREAVKLVDSMREGDQASVVRTAATDKVALQFTGDRNAIRAALQSAFDQGGFRANTQRESERFFFERQVRRSGSIREYQSTAHRYAARVNARIEGTLNALRGMISVLAPQAGKKTIVLLSESLTSEPGREAFSLTDQLAMPETPAIGQQPGQLPTSNAPTVNLQDEMPDDSVLAVIKGGEPLWYDARAVIRRIGGLASAAGITIYSLQPELGVAFTPGASRDGAVISAYQREIMEGTRDTLQTLADSTGGKSYIGEREFADAFQQIESDTSSYYSIGYRPSDDSNAPHKVEVRIPSQPSLVIRTRREILRQPAQREMNDLVASTLLYPRDVDELHITVNAANPVREGSTYRVKVAVQVPIASLTFIPNGEKYRARFTAHYAAIDGNGTFATGADREQILEGDAAHAENAKKHQFTYTTDLVVARGRTRIAIGVQDPISRLTSFKTVSVDAR